MFGSHTSQIPRWFPSQWCALRLSSPTPHPPPHGKGCLWCQAWTKLWDLAEEQLKEAVVHLKRADVDHKYDGMAFEMLQERYGVLVHCLGKTAAFQLRVDESIGSPEEVEVKEEVANVNLLTKQVDANEKQWVQEAKKKITLQDLKLGESLERKEEMMRARGAKESRQDDRQKKKGREAEKAGNQRGGKEGEGKVRQGVDKAGAGAEEAQMKRKGGKGVQTKKRNQASANQVAVQQERSDKNSVAPATSEERCAQAEAEKREAEKVEEDKELQHQAKIGDASAQEDKPDKEDQSEEDRDGHNEEQDEQKEDKEGQGNEESQEEEEEEEEENDEEEKETAEGEEGEPEGNEKDGRHVAWAPASHEGGCGEDEAKQMSIDDADLYDLPVSFTQHCESGLAQASEAAGLLPFDPRHLHSRAYISDMLEKLSTASDAAVLEQCVQDLDICKGAVQDLIQCVQTAVKDVSSGVKKRKREHVRSPT